MIVSVAIWNPGSELKLLAKTCREMEKDELSLSLEALGCQTRNSRGMK